MGKKVMLAVAGAGKTYHICNEIQLEKKNLILAYTHENIRNIKRELMQRHGSVPELTNIMTFDSFVYSFLLRPYEPTILRHFKCKGFKSKGITLDDPPVQRIKTENNRMIPNPKYIKKDRFAHYINLRRQYYCANLSELIMVVKENKKPLIKKVANGINMFYDQIMIDEFQDFREHDFDLIIALAKELDNILLVEDYYQHSVSAINNSGKPIKKGKVEVTYNEFKKLLSEEHKFDVDETTLKASRRCPKVICEYVKTKLGIDIKSANEYQGQVIWVKNNLNRILEDKSITKLVFRNANKFLFNAVNWSYSKGDTMDNVCVILTEPFKNLDANDFSYDDIAKTTLNKLYVAMTRTKGNLYLIKFDDFKLVKKEYLKES